MSVSACVRVGVCVGVCVIVCVYVYVGVSLSKRYNTVFDKNWIF